MSRRTAWALYGLLIAAAVAATFLGRSPSPRSELPSVDNTGPEGLKALATWLEAGGVKVIAHRDALDALPPDTATVVIPAPEARPVTAAEVEAVRRFVEAGGLLVYLTPSDPDAQPHLAALVRHQAGSFLPTAAVRGRDPSGASAEVWVRQGALAGVDALRVAAGATLRIDDPRFVPVAGLGPEAALWRASLGQGEVLVAQGASLASNRRIALEDNAQLWANIAAAGPVAFSELHHAPPPRPPASSGLYAVALQFLICAAVFVWARGARLGPPRPLAVERHRSTLEYLHAFAWLTRRAKVEPELVREGLVRLRRTMQDLEGIPVALPASEAALRLEEACGVPREDFLQALAEAEAAALSDAVDRGRYRRIVGELSRLEDALTGRRSR